MVVISQPGDELVGGGKNAKYVQECKELFLGNKGIEKLRGFELFVNLESLWLHGNKLKKVNNLDTNFRIKVLYVQDNQICTLKGSLACFTFLEQLDISNNQLRDLEKLLKVLEKFKFLTHLNLQGNPCCEEPDYRLLVVQAMPGLKVLDQHTITPAERTKAKGLIGGDVATLTVAFGKRVPVRDPTWGEKVQERSVLEQELGKEALRVRDLRIVQEGEAELAQFSHNPHPDIPRGRSMPPNAGTKRAMELWNTQSLDAAGSPGRLSPPGSTLSLGRSAASRKDGMAGDSTAASVSAPKYVAKDRLVLYSCGPSPSQDLLQSGTCLTSAGGPIGFEQQPYQDFVARKTTGTLGAWDLKKTKVKI